MTVIRVSYHNGNASYNNLAGYNNVGSPSTTGERVSDLLDINGISTGVSLVMSGAYSGASGSIGNATESPDPDFLPAFFAGFFFAGSTEVGSVLDRFSGLPPGVTYTLKIAGHSLSDPRDTEYSVASGSPNPALYDNTSSTTPALPVTITGTVPGNGQVDISLAIVSVFAYVNGYQIEYTEASGSTITNINTTNEVTPGATATATCTNATNATGLNIGSVSQADFTVVNDTTVTFTGTRGGNPYNQDLTATLLSPDGDATITVQQVPEAGTFAVTAASPNTTDDASLWSGLIDTATSNPVTVVDGDQAWVRDPNNLGNLSITPAGAIIADTTGEFVVQFRKASEGVWGSDQTVTFEVPDNGGGTPVDPVTPDGQSIRSTVRNSARNTVRSTRRTL